MSHNPGNERSERLGPSESGSNPLELIRIRETAGPQVTRTDEIFTRQGCMYETMSPEKGRSHSPRTGMTARHRQGGGTASPRGRVGVPW